MSPNDPPPILRPSRNLPAIRMSIPSALSVSSSQIRLGRISDVQASRNGKLGSCPSPGALLTPRAAAPEYATHAQNCRAPCSRSGLCWLSGHSRAWPRQRSIHRVGEVRTEATDVLKIAPFGRLSKLSHPKWPKLSFYYRGAAPLLSVAVPRAQAWQMPKVRHEALLQHVAACCAPLTRHSMAACK